MESYKKITIKEGMWEKISDTKDKYIHLILIATKPDIIKQAPLINKLKEKNIPYLVGHTGQHKDWNLSGGMEQEFNIDADFNLNIDGTFYQKVSQIIDRLGWIIDEAKKRKKILLPYTHGDTATAMAGSIGGYVNVCSVVHVEAGLRTHTPKKEIFDNLLNKPFDFSLYRESLLGEKNWIKGSREPYPEQFNTRVAETATSFHFASVGLNAKNILEEGFEPDRVFTVGNTVADAVKFVEKKAESSDIFKEFPVLNEGFIRFCIHRRENVSSFHRFSVIIESIKELISMGKNILLISLPATEHALKEYDLKKEIEDLAKTNKNFIYSPVWPFYTDVIAAMKKATLFVTDSGSMQEEANILGIPCATLRFNSDRSESVMAGANIIAPPIASELITKITLGADNNKEMAGIPNLYGENVSEKIVNIVTKVLSKENAFRFEQERLGLNKLPFWKEGGVEF